MAIGLTMQFKGVGAAKYDAIMKEMGLVGNKAKWPEGIISHTAGASPDGWTVVDIWESQAHFDKFFAGRLKPAFDKVGGMPQPQVGHFSVHNQYRPG